MSQGDQGILIQGACHYVPVVITITMVTLEVALKLIDGDHEVIFSSVPEKTTSSRRVLIRGEG